MTAPSLTAATRPLAEDPGLPRGPGRVALLLALLLLGALLGAGLLTAALSLRGDVLTLTGDDGMRRFWTAPPVILATSLLLTVAALSAWIRLLAARRDATDLAALDEAADEAQERALAPLRDLAATLSRLIHEAAALNAAGRAAPPDAGTALDAVLRANQQADRLERVLPELMLTVARLSQSDASRAAAIAARMDAALAGLDRSAETLAQATQDGQNLILALEQATTGLDTQAGLIADQTHQAGVVAASLPEAASQIHAAAARLAQDGAGVATALDRGTALIDALTNAAALVHASAARLLRDGGEVLDGLQHGARDFTATSTALAAAHQQTATMLGALPEATLLVHAAADRLADTSQRGAWLVEQAELELRDWSRQILRLLQAFPGPARLDPDLERQIIEMLNEADALADATQPDATQPDDTGLLHSVEVTIARLQDVAAELTRLSPPAAPPAATAA